MGIHLGLSKFVSVQGFGVRGSGLDGSLRWLDLCRTVGTDQNETFAVGDGCSKAVAELLDEGVDID